MEHLNCFARNDSIVSRKICREYLFDQTVKVRSVQSFGEENNWIGGHKGSSNSAISITARLIAFRNVKRYAMVVPFLKLFSLMIV